MNTTEREITLRTVAQRLNKPLEDVERLIYEFKVLGWQLTKPTTHADIQFTPRRSIPSVLEGDK